jgi:hypothetical protein
MARKTPQQQQIEDENKGKYFHIMLNMYDDDLSPYEYRLLGHYIRVGKCWEGVRKTAKTCQMSVGMVVKTRNKLHAGGYITVEHRDNDTVYIEVVDRMHENVARYANRSPHEQGVHHMNTNRSPHEQGVQDVNERITPEEEPEKKNQEEPNHSPNGARKPNPHSEMMDLVGKAYGFGTEAVLTSNIAAVLRGTSKARGWKEYNVNPPMTLEEATQFFEDAGDYKAQKPISLQAAVYKWRAAASRRQPAYVEPDIYDGDDVVIVSDEIYQGILK